MINHFESQQQYNSFKNNFLLVLRMMYYLYYIEHRQQPCLTPFFIWNIVERLLIKVKRYPRTPISSTTFHSLFHCTQSKAFMQSMKRRTTGLLNYLLFSIIWQMFQRPLALNKSYLLLKYLSA